MSRPTAAQKRHFGRVFSLGCAACRQEGKFSFPQIHHWREYGYRDHNLVIPICPVHHVATSAVKGIPNRHLNPVEFAAKFGTDKELYEQTMELLGEKV